MNTIPNAFRLYFDEKKKEYAFEPFRTDKDTISLNVASVRYLKEPDKVVLMSREKMTLVTEYRFKRAFTPFTLLIEVPVDGQDTMKEELYSFETAEELFNKLDSTNCIVKKMTFLSDDISDKCDEDIPELNDKTWIEVVKMCKILANAFIGSR